MAEKIQFFPLDIIYKTIDEKPVIHLFGRTVNGKQICVLDDSFRPYFFVILKEGKDIEDRIKELKIEKSGKISEVTDIEAVNKKYYGRKVKAFKVYTKQPRDVPILREEIKDWKTVESVNEYDIKFVKRYLIDKGITPFTLVEAEGDFVTQRIKVPVFQATRIKQYSDDTLEKPRILAFDIETYNPHGKNIDIEKNPIIMISFYGDHFKRVITWKTFKTNKDYIEFVKSELELLEKFIEIIEYYKPDILTGYFSDGFDLPYIKGRAEKYKINLNLGLDNSELSVSKGITVNSRITGIIHLDIFRFIKKTTDKSLDTESFSLNAVASELLNENKLEVDLNELAETWDKNKENLEEYCEYNLNDSYLTYKLCQKMLPNMTELVKIVGLDIYDINRSGFSQLVEAYLLKQAYNLDVLAPNKPHHDEIKSRRTHTFKGAFVYEPKPGLYKDIIVFDYRSLYPTIISAHNISPDVLNCSCCDGEAKLAPTEDQRQKYWFCKKKKGFLSEIIEDIIKRRMRITEIIKKKKDDKYALLAARQQSLKLLANSFYGYLGFFGARWYSIECARSVTAYGRFYIQKVIEKAKKDNFNVLYSDTDSIFLILDGKSRKEALRFCEEVNLELPGIMELEYEGYYPAGLFVSAKIGQFGAKKKYALLSEEGKIKIKGFEMVRRNGSFIAKEVQENVLNLILKGNDPDKAVKYVQKIISDLREKKIPLEKVIIHTQLQKETSNYESVGPHVAVAKRMEKKGINVGPGSLIKFVIIQGNKKIRDRARLPEEVKKSEYDADYYIGNQIIPSIERIFNVLGYKKEDLLESKFQSKLGEFMK